MIERKSTAELTLKDLYNELDVLDVIDDYSILPSFHTFEAQSSKAVMLVFDDYGSKWLPKSVLRVDTDETIYVKDWFYKKEF